jgi:hypothetical protein
LHFISIGMIPAPKSAAEIAGSRSRGTTAPQLVLAEENDERQSAQGKQ